MEEYAELRFYALSRKSKKYKECINYFDEYKACLIGINMHSMAPKREFSPEELELRKLAHKEEKPS